jgi:hypothetical protein
MVSGLMLSRWTWSGVSLAVAFCIAVALCITVAIALGITVAVALGVLA